MSTPALAEWKHKNLPSHNGMPSLEDLKSEMGTLILNRVFRRGGPRNTVSYARVMNLVRLVSNAIDAYESGRESFGVFVGKYAVLGPLLSATDHLEHCINCASRAIRFAESIRSDPYEHKPLLARNTEVLRVSKRIKNLRNAIEHLEKNIGAGKISQGEYFMLHVRADTLELAGCVVRHEELARWLRQLHEFAQRAARYHEDEAEAV